MRLLTLRRNGPFFIFFAGALLVVSLLFPVPGSFPAPDTFEPPDQSAGLCLALSYTSPPEGMLLPAFVSLASDTLYRVGDRQVYRATAPADSTAYPGLGWAPVGRDSLDLGWDGSPVLRIAVRGNSAGGRGGWAQHGNIYLALKRRQFGVRAVAAPCGVQPHRPYD